MIRTGTLFWASDKARLIEVQVFPSFGCELATSRTFGGSGVLENRIALRKAL